MFVYFSLIIFFPAPCLSNTKPTDRPLDQQSDYGAMAQATPASIVPQPSERRPAGAVAPARAKAVASKDIWEEDEVQDSVLSEVFEDPRPQPEYDIVYKQAVSPEDVYLGMSNRDPSSSSCEDLVVKVQLPGTTMAQVNLDVTDKLLDLRTPKFRLCLPLPHPCDSKNGSAKWDASRETLSVTLRMVREYDFLRT